MIPASLFHSICFAEPGNGGLLAVCYSAHDLVDYLFASNGDLLCQELLDRLNCHLPSPNKHLFGGRVCYGSKFCLILSRYINDDSSWSLAVATFDVKCVAGA